MAFHLPAAPWAFIRKPVGTTELRRFNENIPQSARIPHSNSSFLFLFVSERLRAHAATHKAQILMRGTPKQAKPGKPTLRIKLEKVSRKQRPEQLCSLRVITLSTFRTAWSTATACG